MKGHDTGLRVVSVVGALFAYGSLCAFAYVVGLQCYRWFRDGEWTHIGVSDGLRSAVVRCCVRDGETGHLADLVRWLDAPVDWLGLHKVLEVLPASLAWFVLSILGNFLFIYCSDRLDSRVSASEQHAA